MLFDLKKFFIAGKMPEQREFEADFTAHSFSGATMQTPASAVFVAERGGEGIYLTLRAKALFKSNCARCLDEIEHEEVVDVEWTVRERDLDDPDFELPLDEKGKLDVSEWLFQEFMFQIPTVLVCSADCVGLCPECGEKVANCRCEHAQAEETTPIDPRLSVLKSLLN